MPSRRLRLREEGGGRWQTSWLLRSVTGSLGGVISFSIEAMVGRYSKTGFTGDTDEREPSINIG